MNQLSEAICFATKAFDGKYRKGENYPAIFHSLEAAAAVQSFYDDEDVVCAAVLHDTVEDTKVTLDEIREKFGEHVAFLVQSETEEKYAEVNPSETWLLRKERTLQTLKESTDPGIRAMWLGDKLSNMRSFAKLKKHMGDKMWDLFNQKSPDAHYAYYHAIVEELAMFADTDAYAEFTELIKSVFGR